MDVIDELNKNINEHIIDLSYVKQKFTSDDLKDIKIKLKENNHICYIIFDDDVIKEIIKSNELEKLFREIQKQLTSNIFTFNPYPTDFLLCLFSRYTYNYNDKTKQESNLTILNYIKRLGWIVVPKKKEINNYIKDSYFSLIFKNQKLKQLVIAFKGIELNLDNLFKDEQTSKAGNIKNKLNQHYIKINETIDSDMKQVENECKKFELNLTFTGYSFGTWMALKSLLKCNFEISSKAVFFESSGSKKLMSILNSHDSLKEYNITSYLTEPNFFNKSNTHIGNQYVIKNTSNYENEITTFSRLADLYESKFRGICNFYKCKILQVYKEYLKDFSEQESRENLTINFNKKVQNLNNICKDKLYYINGIEALTDKRLRAIENQFDLTNGELDNIYEIVDWKTKTSDSKGELEFYKSTLDKIFKEIDSFKNNKEKISSDYVCKIFNNSSCYISKAEKGSNIDYYLNQLNACIDLNLKIDNEFIKKHLKYIKTLYTIERFDGKDILKSTDNYKYKIANIKNALERVIFIDKRLKLKLGKITNFENYKLISESNINNNDLIYRFPDDTTDFQNIDMNYKIPTTIGKKFKKLRESAENVFQTITNNLTDNNKFIDMYFIADNSSLYNHPEVSTRIECLWLRPTEIQVFELNRNNLLNRPFYRNPNSNQVIQGHVGDCWLVSCLSIIAEHKHLLERIFLTSNIITQEKCNQYGSYVLNLCIRGEWKHITIDDQLPCYEDGTLLYAKTLNRQIWASLIEKAIAKENRTYENLSGGWGSEGFSILTGCPSEYFNLENLDTSTKNDLWNKIKHFSKSDTIITCSCNERKDKKDCIKKDLILGHAYSLLKAIEFEGYNLILLRNPHAASSWIGDWSGKEINSKWNERLRKRFRKYYPDLPIDEFHNSGVFWISYDDILSYFYSLTFCYLNKKYTRRFIGKNFFDNTSVKYNAFKLTIKDDSSKVYIELFTQYEKNSELKPDIILIILNKDKKIENFIHLDYKDFYLGIQITLKKGIYKLIPMSFRYWDTTDTKIDMSKIKNKYNLVIHSFEKFFINEITERTDNIHKMILDWEGIKNASENSFYFLQYSNHTFLIGNNNTDEYLKLKIEMSPAVIAFTPKNKNIKTRDLQTDKNFSSSRSLERSNDGSFYFEDMISPHCKKILSILTDYSTILNKDEKDYIISVGKLEINHKKEYVKSISSGFSKDYLHSEIKI